MARHRRDGTPRVSNTDGMVRNGTVQRTGKVQRAEGGGPTDGGGTMEQKTGG
uniref:Uncharacterized protein n=1 Tax=Picea glauca TaxID=3330 RepID=A0A101LYY6_PICGL|nr:hypothetical protein ABT39_MTgene4939 [Picea glauca]